MIPVSLHASHGPKHVPSIGEYCWEAPPTAGGNAPAVGYEIYVTTTPGDASGLSDIGNPGPQTNCGTAFGIVRDQSGSPDGDFYVGVRGYDTEERRGPWTEVDFTLRKALDSLPPAAVGSSVVVQ